MTMNIPHEAQVLVIAGASGSGKSHLVARLKESLPLSVHIVDALVDDVGHFGAPAVKPEVFIVDHLEFVRGMASYVRDLLAWADSNKVSVVLVGFSSEDLRRMGVELPASVMEMTLHGRDGDRGITVVSGERRRTLTLEEFVEGCAAVAVEP